MLVRPESILSALPVVNISQQHVPTGDTAFGVVRGESVGFEPPVHAIGTAVAELEFIRLPVFDSVPPHVDHAGKIIRMDRVAHGPILQFLVRLAEVFQDLAVEMFDLARGIQSTHKPGNAVDDQTKAFLTLIERKRIDEASELVLSSARFLAGFHDTRMHRFTKRKLIALINDDLVVRKILAHLGLPTEPPRLAPARAPPQVEFAFEG